MRLIDADEVVETLLTTEDIESVFLDLAQNRRLDYLHDVEELDVVDFARDIVKAVIGVIKTSTAVDAEPVRHGHWVENHYEFYVLDENYKPVLLNGIGYKCSICNKDNEKTTDYCPHCGAKMDEVSE